MGLARLWQSWGIEPDVVLGHSVGQYAAACVAGVFSLEDGARLLAERGRLFGNLPEGGRMVAVFADAEHVEDVADEFPQVSVAAYNGPNTVLSVRPRTWKRSSPSAAPTESAAPGWTRVTPSIPSYWSRHSTNSSRTQSGSSSPSRPCRWSATAPVRSSRLNGNGRTVLAAAFPAARAVRRKRPHHGAAGMLGAHGDRPATGSSGCDAGMAGILCPAACYRVAA